MNKENGYIKVYRAIQENDLWQYTPYDPARAWIDLLLSATYKNKGVYFDGSIVDLLPGEFITSQVKLARKWGWERKRVSRFLRVLESEQMCHIKTDRKKTLIAIHNWETYQQEGQQKGQARLNRRDTINKERRKEKNINILEKVQKTVDKPQLPSFKEAYQRVIRGATV